MRTKVFKMIATAMLLNSGMSFAMTKLIGGRVANESELKSTVRINNGCTASKIEERTFMLAAHCMTDVKLATVSSEYLPGAPVDISTHYGERITTTIDSSSAHSTYLNLVKKKLASGSRTNGGALSSFDIGVFRVTEDTLTIPVTRVDFDYIAAGEEIVIGGYGCQDSIHTFKDPGTYKISNSKVMSGSLIVSDYYKRDITHTNRYNFYSAGKTLSAEAASLCPGDSGGPVYSKKSKKIIGVNSQYIFGDASGVSLVNTHVRLNELKTWITGFINRTRYID